MAKTWLSTRKGDLLVRRSHITDVYISTGKTEENRNSEKFQYFVKATARGEEYVLAGGFDTKQETLAWMFKEFK